MEDLADFLSDSIEFIVGGIAFVASLAWLSYAVEPAMTSHFASSFRGLPDGASLVVLIAVAYGMGVIAEGVSRTCFEGFLTYRTVSIPRDTAHDEPYQYKPTGEHPQYRALWPFDWPTVKPRAGGGKAGSKDSGEGAKPEGYGASRATRERRRLRVVDHDPMLGAMIHTQLKRLRIERTFLLSSGIGMVGSLLTFGLHFVSVVMFAGTAACLWLVWTRSERYQKTIDLAYELVKEKGP